jgi:hypothetical protein
MKGVMLRYPLSMCFLLGLKSLAQEFASRPEIIQDLKLSSPFQGTPLHRSDRDSLEIRHEIGQKRTKERRQERADKRESTRESRGRADKSADKSALSLLRPPARLRCSAAGRLASCKTLTYTHTTHTHTCTLYTHITHTCT